MIDKAPQDPGRFALDRRFTRSARAAFAHVLSQLSGRGGRILLPAYIGQSPLEGSGVFDPIAAARVPFAFYRIDRDLRVDLDHLAGRLAEAETLAIFVIHYFGAAEPQLPEIAELARQHQTLLIEDCAHAIGSTTAGGVEIGSVGDLALYSIHKVLAVDSGGVLRVNRGDLEVAAIPDAAAIDPRVRAELERADWAAIRRRRVDNYRQLAAAIAGVDGVELFWPELPAGAIPQNLPVRITATDRFEVYKRMRAAGVGVVALYHTLIEAIDPAAYPLSHQLSQTILNLPIHQEIEVDDIPRIAETLRAAVLG